MKSTQFIGEIEKLKEFLHEHPAVVGLTHDKKFAGIYFVPN